MLFVCLREKKICSHYVGTTHILQHHFFIHRIVDCSYIYIDDKNEMRDVFLICLTHKKSFEATRQENAANNDCDNQCTGTLYIDSCSNL